MSNIIDKSDICSKCFQPTLRQIFQCYRVPLSLLTLCDRLLFYIKYHSKTRNSYLYIVIKLCREKLNMKMAVISCVMLSDS